MACACGVLLETGLRGPVAPGRVAGVPVVVTADQQIHWVEVEHKHGKTKTKVKSKDLAEQVRLPASVGDRLRLIPGATVVADRAFTAEIYGANGSFVAGVHGRTYGHNWAAALLTPYRLVSGHAPVADGEMVLDARLAARAGVTVGDRIGVQASGSPATFVITGTAQARAPVTQESALFFSEHEAEVLAAHGTSVTAYGVFGAGAGAVRAAVRGTTAQVATGEDRGAAVLPGTGSARTRLISMAGAIGGTALVVALLVVVGTVTQSVRLRHRELALLRAIGATPRQVRRLVRREAVVLALIAGPTGALAGLPLADVLHRRLVSGGAVTDAIAVVHSPFAILGSVLATLLAATVAARVAARRVSRIRPVEALGEAGVERRTATRGATIAGLVVTGAAAAVSVLLARLHTEPAAVPATYLCELLWMTALALLGPVLVRTGAAVLSGAWRVSPVGGFLAQGNARAYSRRTASVMTPLALLIGMSATFLFVPGTLAGAVESETGESVRAAVVLGSAGPGVPAAAVARVRAVPGVSAAVGSVTSSIWIGHDRRSATGVTTPGLTDVLDPGVATGSLRGFGDGDVAMSETAAQGRRVGDRVRATLGDGTTATFTLVAVYRRGLGVGDTLMSFTRLVEHVDTPLAQHVFIAGSVSVATIGAAVAGVPGVRLVDGSVYARTVAGRQRADDAAGFVLLAVIIAFCGIAVLTAQATATTSRGQDFALLRLAGGTAGQVRSMLRWELTLTVLLASALAAGASWSTLAGFSLGMTGRAAPAVDPLTCAGVVLGAVCLGGLSLFGPAAVLLRRPPAAEITSSA